MAQKLNREEREYRKIQRNFRITGLAALIILLAGSIF